MLRLAGGCALIALIAACGGASPPPGPANHHTLRDERPPKIDRPLDPPPSPPPTDSPAVVTAPPAALFASLFRNGQSWRFALRLTAQFAVNGRKVSEQRTGLLTCTVGRVEEANGGWHSSIDCDGEWPFATSAPLVYGPTGGFASPAGLLLDFANNDGFVLPAQPRAVRSKGGAEDNQVTYTIEAFRGGWCISHASEGFGARYGETLCVRGGDVVGGSAYSGSSNGSEIKRASYGETPR